jgi:NAD-dependent dihydropyrimidine dehydrogenase PreA subunit
VVGMIRNIVKIDSEKCNGCGACAEACAEGAIQMINGKAVLVSEAYCDGLGACLPSCPADAISIEKRETVPFVTPSDGHSPAGPSLKTVPIGGIPMAPCSGSGPRRIVHDEETGPAGVVPSRLSQWPVQLRLIPAGAPYLEDCDLLLAADCSAYAYGNFHERFIRGRVTLIGCPKLDPQESWKKLTDILAMHNIRSITVTRMEVPCCSGLVNAVLSATEHCGRKIPVKVCTLTANGRVLEDQTGRPEQ